MRIAAAVTVASETFRVPKNNEIRQFGEYRTQRLVLEAWDRLIGVGEKPEATSAFPEMKTTAPSSSDGDTNEGDHQAMDQAADDHAPSSLVALSIKNFAHLHCVDLGLSDLTILVGPQGAGKRLALPWLKQGSDSSQRIVRCPFQLAGPCPSSKCHGPLQP